MSETTVNPLAAQIAASRQMIEALVAKANESATRVRSVQNQKSAVSDLIKESDDEIVVKFREQRDKLMATLANWEKEVTQHVEANLIPKNTDIDVEKETASYKEAKAAVTGFVNALKILAGEDSVKDLPEMQSLGRTSSTAGVTGIKRPRVERIRIKDASKPDDQYAEVIAKVKNPKDGSIKDVVSFSVLSTKIKSEFGEKVDANTLREHAEGVAGAYDSWASRNGEPFEFAVSFGDGDKRKHLMVEVTPQNND